MANVLLFKIENTWGNHLYHILAPLAKYDNGCWIVSDTQIWYKKTNDFVNLFSDKQIISNEYFFSIIKGRDYYIVEGCFQLMKNNTYKHDADVMLSVKIYDSIYVEMYTNDVTVFDQLYRNAMKEQFLDIKIER